MTAILIFFFAHYFLAVLAQTFFLHRYASHGMFTMNKFWERFFHIFTLVAQGPSFLEPYSYAVLHKMHHAHSDTPQDPHSPVQTKNLFHMMWQTKQIYSGILSRRVIPEPAFDAPEAPRWPLIDQFAHHWPWRILSGSVFVFFYMAFVPEGMWYLYLLVPVHWVIGPIHGAIVNYCGHRIGYVNFRKTKDNSRNSLPIDLLTFGELFQNNHHGRAQSPNFAARWWEIDPGYQFVRIMNRLGVIQLRRAPA